MMIHFRPNMQLFATFKRPIEHMQMDAKTKTLIVFTDEGVHRIALPGLSHE